MADIKMPFLMRLLQVLNSSSALITENGMKCDKIIVCYSNMIRKFPNIMYGMEVKCY